MTCGYSSSSRPGAGLPASRRSRRASLAMLRREAGGQACSGRRRAREPSRACSMHCATRMCGIFLAEFLLRPWCSTVAATAPFASAPAGISPAISRMRNSSSSTAPITGSSRAISNRSWPALDNSSAVSGRDREQEMQAKDRLATVARAECVQTQCAAFCASRDFRFGVHFTLTRPCRVRIMLWLVSCIRPDQPPAANNRAWSSRNCRLSSFPLGFLGSASANTIRFGILNDASIVWACASTSGSLS